MQFATLFFKGPLLITPEVYFDERGFFSETYNRNSYQEIGVSVDFVQDNHSFSKRGVLRGMHFQHYPGQAKLVSVIVGEIFDVVVDIRKTSPTFGKWEGVILNEENRRQLFIPIGFAHGFCVMSPSAHVVYKVSSFFDPKEEKCFRYDDVTVGIKWPCSEFILSEKDLKAPSLEKALALLDNER